MLPVRNSYAHPTERYFVPGNILSRVMEEAAYHPRCSDDKTAKWQRPREYAVRLPYMQSNRPGMVSWLIFDLDHRRSWAWEDAGLPPPNIIVQNRNNLHSQLFYAIVPVCTTEKARSAPIAYMKAIYEAMAARLDADSDYHGGPAIAKTPGHPWWSTTEMHTRVYELSELADHVELAPPRPFGKTANLDEISHSRHQLLFEYVRQFAYAIVNRERETGNFSTFTRLVEAYAHNRNSFQKMGFEVDLPLSSIRATVKSITRWTWTHYTGSTRCHRGVMQLDPDLPIPARQQLAAHRTHDVRRTAAEAKVRRACCTLRERGAAITQAAIAALASLSRQTVAKYKHVLSEPVPTVVALPVAKKSDVKYGAHQVTGGQKGLPEVESNVLPAVEIFDGDAEFGVDPPAEKIYSPSDGSKNRKLPAGRGRGSAPHPPD